MANASVKLADSDFLYETSTLSHGSTVDPMHAADNSSLLSYDEHYELNKVLATYVTPTLFFISVIGNSLIFAVFSMKTYKTSLTAMLYRVLAVTDGFSVVIRVGLHALPLTTTETSCKIIMFLLCWSRVFSVWLIVVITAARVIIVWVPHKTKHLNTKRRYTWGIVANLLLSFGLYAPLLATAGHNAIELDGQTSVCVFFGRDIPSTMEWYRVLFNWSILLSVLATMLFVFIANSVIVYGIRRSRKSVNASNPSSATNDARKNNNVTILLLISSTSVLFNIPDVIYVVLSSYHKDQNSQAFASLLTLRAFLPVFDSINRSINIIFFCGFGREFRQHLKVLLSRPCKDKGKSNELPLSSRS